MTNEKTKGYQDQELLIMAFVSYASKEIDRSVQIIKGMMRQSITEWVSSNKISIKDLKDKEEHVRLKALNEMIDIFLEKIKQLVQSKFSREKLKKDAIQIWSHWTKTRRTDPTDDIVNEIEEFVSMK